MTPSETVSSKVVRPAKLAHLVLRTNRFAEQREFYKAFLGGHEAYGNDFLSFITYDDEHHRIALLGAPGTTDKDPNSCGIAHVAFTFDSLKDLCTAYRQRKALGMEPGWCVNHGPTISMYYRDVDGNVVETQVDNFADPDEATKWMMSPAFAANPLGTDFDAEELSAAVLDRGEDEDKLKKPNPSGSRDGSDIAAIEARIMAMIPSVRT